MLKLSKMLLNLEETPLKKRRTSPMKLPTDIPVSLPKPPVYQALKKGQTSPMKLPTNIPVSLPKPPVNQAKNCKYF